MSKFYLPKNEHFHEIKDVIPAWVSVRAKGSPCSIDLSNQVHSLYLFTARKGMGGLNKTPPLSAEVTRRDVNGFS